MAVLRFHFHRTKTPIGALIRWRTLSEFNHTSVEFNGYTYDAKLGRPLKRLNKPSKGIVETIEFEIMNIDTIIQIRAELESHVGRDYDVAAMFGFAFNIDTQSRRRTYCSELTMLILAIIMGGRAKPFPYLISPKDAYVAVLSYHSSYKKHRYEEAICQQHPLP